jgi:hypothetical protein
MDLDVASMLARTPDVLAAMLEDLPDAWLRRDDGPGTWSAYDIVGHLIGGEEVDWLPRVRMIVREGASRPFEPVDREAMLGRPPEPGNDLLARFTALRRANLEELAAMDLTPADLDRLGLHPAFGEVTLGQLLSTWATHDLTHIAQIGDVLARRNRDAVGPWRAYLPSLDRVAEAE